MKNFNISSQFVQFFVLKLKQIGFVFVCGVFLLCSCFDLLLSTEAVVGGRLNANEHRALMDLYDSLDCSSRECIRFDQNSACDTKVQTQNQVSLNLAVAYILYTRRVGYERKTTH